MFRTVGDKPSLFESVLPEQLLRVPEELARVDVLLDDPGVPGSVRAVLRPADRSAADVDGELPADDVPEVPLPAGVREPVPGGERLDRLATILPDPAGGGRCRTRLR